MKRLREELPIVLLFLFEALVGVLLLTAPEKFTRAIVILFGILLLLLFALYLYRFIRAKKEGFTDAAALIIFIASGVLGLICAVFPGTVTGLIAVIAVLYGLILLIGGIFKLQSYALARNTELAASPVLLASGVLSVIAGVVVILFPKDAAFTVFQIAGVLLIIEAAADLISLIHTHIREAK